MPQFVVLEHNWPNLHWDLMLESGDSLKTWRLQHPPTPGQWLPAKPISAHRLIYLTYEGPVSRDRGHVKRILQGFYAPKFIDGVTELSLSNCDFAKAELRIIDSQTEWRLT